MKEEKKSNKTEIFPPWKCFYGLVKKEKKITSKSKGSQRESVFTDLWKKEKVGDRTEMFSPWKFFYELVKKKKW